MKTEFNLSKFIIRGKYNIDSDNYILVLRIKEFIKIVELDYEKEWDKATENNSVIDKNKLREILIKRAGDKLKELKNNEYRI